MTKSRCFVAIVAVIGLLAACGDDDGAAGTDGGGGVDAGGGMDAGAPIDGGGPGRDAGSPRDGGSPIEGGAPLDTGPGPGIDAGTTMDAGSPAVDAGPRPDAGPIVDMDGDGLDDGEEMRLMMEYLPFLNVDPGDTCPLAGIIFRLRPHPASPTRIHAIVDMLFENDCGASGHIGDDEVFGITIDPSRPAPAGILAIRAISHQATACEHISNCGPCPGAAPALPACTTAMRAGAPFPVVFYSRNKHGAYMSEAACDGACFFTNQCTATATPAMPMMVNAGEPAMPLTRNLTAAGLITMANGWSDMRVFDYDPWGPDDFGGAGSVRGDLMDDAFLTPACAP